LVFALPWATPLGFCAAMGVLPFVLTLTLLAASGVRIGSHPEPPRARSSPRRVPAERRVKDSSGRFVT
jgi:hypothetical protein